ncbi:unnamed protein product [Phytophthora fragariaefolia]|uniref:Unnamed protein product n=1 Tax=Phytophthora fragariaefolia TaxID=1490495 RepID=A0A9W7CW82_9STRA|nr:unnamed protein product [Phytophthora fragariaefolia]
MHLSNARSPVLITLWLGANDAALADGTAARQHVPVADYKVNLAKIVQAYQTSAPSARVLLITPPHVDDAIRKSRSPAGLPERTNAAAAKYARACVEVADELKMPVLDLYSFFNAMPESERAACLDDGLHFTATGNRLVDAQVHKKIRDAFPEVVQQLEAWQLPDFHIWMDAWFIQFALPVIKRELVSGGVSPSLITLWLGANDAALADGPSSRQHVAVEGYASNLEEIVLALRTSAPNADLLIITPPHVDDAARRHRRAGHLDRSNAMAGAYAKACVDTAEKLRVPVLDLHTIFNALSAHEQTMALADGLHLSAWGNRLVDRLLWAKVADAFPALASRLQVQVIPNWDRLT